MNTGNQEYLLFNSHQKDGFRCKVQSNLNLDVYNERNGYSAYKWLLYVGK